MSKTTVLNFTSVGDYCNLKPSDTNKAALNHAFESGAKRGKEWFGAESQSAAEKILSVGWPEGVARAKEVMGKIQIPGQIKCIRKKLTMATSGDEVDYEKLMQGEERCYKKWAYEEGFTTAADKHIRINVDTDACGWVTAEEMFWKGAAAAVLADALEESGRTVEIVGYFFSTGHSAINPQDRLYVNCVLKKEGEPLDLNRLMALTGCASSLRILGFKALASSEDQITSSFGRPIRYVDVKGGWPDIPGAEGVPQVYITDIWNKQAAMNWLADYCKAMDANGKAIEFVDEPPPPANLDGPHVIDDEVEVKDEMTDDSDDEKWV